jgi:hypothetical protein
MVKMPTIKRRRRGRVPKRDSFAGSEIACSRSSGAVSSTPLAGLREKRDSRKGKVADAIRFGGKYGPPPYGLIDNETG